MTSGGGDPAPGRARVPMTPLAFLARSARMFGERTAVIDRGLTRTYAELHAHVGRLAAALRAQGIGSGDVVAVLAGNTRHLLEAHYSVPAAGGVLLALNNRLTAGELEYIVSHAGATLLVYDEEFAETAGEIPVRSIAAAELDEFEGEGEVEWIGIEEDGLLALNYTSGTTGRPKGVMYHHRGAYLQALAMAYHSGMGPGSVHLWTLPMFHCNGWCFTWAVTAAGATHLCLPKVEPSAIWRHLREDGVTHLNAAPTVLSMLAWDQAAEGSPLPQRVRLGTGGSPPSPSLLDRMSALNFEVDHLYGLTETFGPVIACVRQPEWAGLPTEELARLLARQGNANILSSDVRVIDESDSDVAADGEALGEVAIRGNNVMLGYYRAPEESERAFTADGWFRTGDLGVLHADGYVELRDRAKDVIISGGENISSIEIEQAISSHPAVMAVAVVAAPHERWGETPVAHVELKPGAAAVGEEEIVAHVKSRIARFKAPREVRFGELPRTATGKIQKFRLREQHRTAASTGG